MNIIKETINHETKPFHKIRFQDSLNMPKKLYYYYNSQTYANQNNDDSLLQALAEGGFQVDELAKFIMI